MLRGGHTTVDYAAGVSTNHSRFIAHILSYGGWESATARHRLVELIVDVRSVGCFRRTEIVVIKITCVEGSTRGKGLEPDLGITGPRVSGYCVGSQGVSRPSLIVQVPPMIVTQARSSRAGEGARAARRTTSDRLTYLEGTADQIYLQDTDRWSTGVVQHYGSGARRSASNSLTITVVTGGASQCEDNNGRLRIHGYAIVSPFEHARLDGAHIGVRSKAAIIRDGVQFDVWPLDQQQPIDVGELDLLSFGRGVARHERGER